MGHCFIVDTGLRLYSLAQITENVLELLHFEDLPLGGEWTTRRRTITEADLAAFVGLSGDYNPLYTDVEHARATYFGQPVVPAALVAAAATGLGAIDVPVPATVGMVGMTWRFLRPVYVGDTIRTRWRLNRKRDVENPHWGLAVWQVEVENQRGDLVATAELARLISRREQPVEAARPVKSRRRRRRTTAEAAPAAEVAAVPPREPQPAVEPAPRPAPEPPPAPEAAPWTPPAATTPPVPGPEPAPPAPESAPWTPPASVVQPAAPVEPGELPSWARPEPDLPAAAWRPAEPAPAEPEAPRAPAPAARRRRRTPAARPPEVPVVTEPTPAAAAEGQEAPPAPRRRRRRPAAEPAPPEPASAEEPAQPSEPAPRRRRRAGSQPEQAQAELELRSEPPASPRPETTDAPEPSDSPEGGSAGGLAGVFRRLRGGG